VDLLLLRSGDSDGRLLEWESRWLHRRRSPHGVLHFTWSEGDIKGHGVAESNGDALRGTWRTDETQQDGGDWTGVRRKRDTGPR
jgi:hypothetical protein